MTAHIPRFSFLQKQIKLLKNVKFVSDILTKPTSLMIINVTMFF